MRRDITLLKNRSFLTLIFLYVLVTVKPTIQFTVKKSRLGRQTKLYQDAHPHEKSINFGKLPIT